MKQEQQHPPVEIPRQQVGGKTDTTSTIECDSMEQAHQLFLDCKNRLLNINHWGDIAGVLSAEFTLIKPDGSTTTEAPKVGDYIRIDIPGPGTKAGDGFDWVQIEAIEEIDDPQGEAEHVLIRVRPSDNPSNDKEDIAHFLDSKASSSFTLHRQQQTVTAGVHGRNEVPNTSTESLLDKMRNTAVGSAAIMGFNAPQWKGLVNGVMGK